MLIGQLFGQQVGLFLKGSELRVGAFYLVIDLRSALVPLRQLLMQRRPPRIKQPTLPLDQLSHFGGRLARGQKFRVKSDLVRSIPLGQ